MKSNRAFFLRFLPCFPLYYLPIYYILYINNNIYERKVANMEKIKISSEYITLGQFLKYANIVSSGGMVKAILQDTKIHVNDISEARRGKKLYPGDKIVIKGYGNYRISN